MADRTNWSKKDLIYLEESWGRIPLPSIMKRLKRTQSAVVCQAVTMGLGPMVLHIGALTPVELAELTGVTPATVRSSWISKLGLKAEKMLIGMKRNVWAIEIDNFWKWAEQHQDRFHTRKMEVNILGKEPDWMTEKRWNDVQDNKVRNTHWTDQEKEKLRVMMKSGLYTQKEMAEHFRRPKGGIRKQVDTIRAKNRAKRKLRSFQVEQVSV